MNRFDFSHLRGLVLILMRILLAIIFLKAGLNKWPVIDVTRKSVEEAAASIIKIYDIQNKNV